MVVRSLNRFSANFFLLNSDKKSLKSLLNPPGTSSSFPSLSKSLIIFSPKFSNSSTFGLFLKAGLRLRPGGLLRLILLNGLSSSEVVVGAAVVVVVVITCSNSSSTGTSNSSRESAAIKAFSERLSSCPTGLTFGMNLEVNGFRRLSGIFRPEMVRNGAPDEAGRGLATRTRVLGISSGDSSAAVFCPSTSRLSSRASAISGFKMLFNLGLAKSSRILAN